MEMTQEQEKIPPQNLIRQVSVGQSRFSRPEFYKPLIFDAIGLLAALGAGFVYRQYLDGQSRYEFVLLAFLAFAVVSVFQMLFTRTFWRRFPVLILEMTAMLFFFRAYEVRIILLAAVSAVLFVVWGETLGRSEAESRLEIKFFKIARPALQKLATALSLLLIILYLPRLGQTNGFVSRETFASLFGGVSGAVSNFYPEIKLTSSVGDFAESIASQELGQMAAFRNLPDSDKNLALKQTTSRIVDAVGKKLNIVISSKESVSDALYDFFANIFNAWRAGSEYWFIIGWTIMAFIILRGFGIIFYWTAGLVAFLAYQVLLATDFVHIIGESRMHEMLEL